jgi:hypothetical protein
MALGMGLEEDLWNHDANRAARRGRGRGPAARRRASAADVVAAHADAEERDRVNAMNLAIIRKAAQMAQVEVARKLGVGQGVVSRLVHRDDMLLSTLYGQVRIDYARLRPWITAYQPRGTFRGTVFWLIPAQ